MFQHLARVIYDANRARNGLPAADDAHWALAWRWYQESRNTRLALDNDLHEACELALAVLIGLPAIEPTEAMCAAGGRVIRAAAHLGGVPHLTAMAAWVRMAEAAGEECDIC